MRMSMMKGAQVTGFWDLCLEMSMVLVTLMLITLMRQIFLSIAFIMILLHTHTHMVTLQHFRLINWSASGSGTSTENFQWSKVTFFFCLVLKKTFFWCLVTGIIIYPLSHKEFGHFPILSESVYEDCPCQVDLDNEVNTRSFSFFGMVDRFWFSYMEHNNQRLFDFWIKFILPDGNSIFGLNLFCLIEKNLFIVRILSIILLSCKEKKIMKFILTLSHWEVERYNRISNCFIKGKIPPILTLGS